MTTAYTSLLGLALPVSGELSGTWGDTVNDYITKYVDAAVAGAQTISGSQTAVTLSTTTGSTLISAGSSGNGSAQYAIINCTGNPASLLTITAPATSKAYLVLNGTSTSQSVKVVGAGPTTGVTVAASQAALIAWDGTDFKLVATNDLSAISGLLPISKGGTGLTTIPARSTLIANALDTLTTITPGAGQSIRINAGNTAWEAYTPTTGTGDVTASASNAFTGANTFFNSTGQTIGTGTSANDGIVLAGRAGGSSNYRVTIQPTTLTASRTLTLPNNSGTVLTTGAAVTETQGGTGTTTYTTGQILYASATNTLSKRSIGANGHVLTVVGGVPDWAAPSASAGVTSFSAGSTGLTPSIATTGAVTLAGTLAVANGGTGQTSYTNGQLLIGNTTGNTLTKATLTAGTAISVTNGTGSITIANTGVTSFSAGTTGLTPSTGTTGAVTLAGTLAVANGGTGNTTLDGAGIVTKSGTQTLTGEKTFTGGISSSAYNYSQYTSTFEQADGTGKRIELSTANSASTSSSKLIIGSGTGTGGTYSGVIVSTLTVNPSTNNSFDLGTGSIGWKNIYSNNTLNVISDQRQKTDVQDAALGLSFIKALRPVSYRMVVGSQEPDGGVDANGLPTVTPKPGVRTHYGLIAQEVKAAVDAANAGDFAGWLMADKNDPNSAQMLRYGEFISPLIKAVQELSAKVEALEARVTALGG